ncbi:hypothetical protein niasHT_024755 [Heterodera trifolii]|uniref:Ubiquitin-like domain-containing protein n=1 Tax=Heterodera trifolii TaxID=157864 RepID=A0ABD2KNV3_9BILA
MPNVSGAMTVKKQQPPLTFIIHSFNITPYQSSQLPPNFPQNELLWLFTNFKILVNYKNGDEEEIQYTVTVKDTDTVATLKQTIQKETRIEVERQTLKFQQSADGSVTELEDNENLVFYGIVPKSTIHLFCGTVPKLTIHLSTEKFRILVNYKRGDEAKQYTVWVKREKTVATLKRKIMTMMQNEFKIKFQNIRLSCSPTIEATVKAKDGLNDDSKTMEEYGINEDKVIYVLSAFQERPGWDETKGISRFELVHYGNGAAENETQQAQR